jgi:hypothetical protein
LAASETSLAAKAGAAQARMAAKMSFFMCNFPLGATGPTKTVGMDAPDANARVQSWMLQSNSSGSSSSTAAQENSGATRPK